MPLTPEDVSNKRFTAVRLREGYDMGEVDAFLDEVEAELLRLDRENRELRTKLAAALEGRSDEADQDDTGAPASAPASAPAALAAPVVSSPEPDGATAPTATEDTAPESTVTSLDKARGIETIRVSTTPEASAAATRLLELATRSADELVAEARAEAETILGGARTDAERLEQEARSRAEQLDVETTQRREQLFSALDQERSSLAGEVESLRTFEREYRAELKDYFTKQLDALEHPLAHSERFGTGAEATGTRVAEQPRDPAAP